MKVRSTKRKIQQLDFITCSGLIAIVRVDSSAELISIVEAIKKGGLKIIEITMTTPNALEAIKETSERFGDEILLGAGTVLDVQMAKSCLSAGAQFIVGPNVNSEVIKLCQQYDKIVIPGAMTPTEIVNAWQEGADLVKVFPAGILGPKYIKELKAPLPQIPLVPTGGINLENAADFLRAGASAVGVGASLIDKKIVNQGKFELLTEKAKQFLEIIKQAREKGNE